MFTGIISCTGKIESVLDRGQDSRIRIASPDLDMADVQLGDSIAVHGVCLTVIAFDSQGFEVDVSRESLQKTNLGNMKKGAVVNLEKALRLGDRLGGHLVSGHVDGIARVADSSPEGHSVRFRLQAPDSLKKYIAVKGSVTLDGVSLTVNTVDDGLFSVNIIPHTLEVTALKHLKSGDSVHLEVDMIARYVERLLAVDENTDTRDLLRSSGFIS